MTRESPAFTILRWATLFWLLVWLPANTWTWGWQNMMHLCDVGLLLACLGIFFRQPLLVSSQALSAPLVGVLWALDIFWRLLTGHHLVGGTEYMWDPNYPFWIPLSLAGLEHELRL